jgi:hypothetical protein
MKSCCRTSVLAVSPAIRPGTDDEMTVRRQKYKKRTHPGHSNQSIQQFKLQDIARSICKMKFELLNLLLCTALTGPAMAATIDYCKGVNLSGDCRRVNVANDGKCSMWKHGDNLENLTHRQKIMLLRNTMTTSDRC